MTALFQAGLVLLLQTTALLSLGLFVLRLTRHRGPAVQTLVGRAALSGVALLLLLAPLSGRITPVWRISSPALQSALHPAPVRRGALLGGPILGSQNDAEARRAAPSAMPPPPPLSAPSDLPLAPVSPVAAAIPTAGPAVQEGAASRAPTPAVLPALRLPASGGPLRSHLLRSKEVDLCLLPSLALLLWLAVCQGHLTRLRRTAHTVADGPASALLAALTPHPPPLLTHPAIYSPFLAGLRRPAIFLPTAFAADFDADALRAVFTHELAHRDRRDNLWTLAARLLTAALWFQPLLWLLCRRLEQISEDACDEAVLAASCPPRAYAACLLSLAERPPLTRRQRSLTAGVAPFRSSLGRRVQRILTLGVPIMPAVTLRLRLSIAALTLAAALSGAFLVSSAPAQNSPSKPQPTVLTAQERQYVAERNQDLANLKAIGQALVHYVDSKPNLRLPDAKHWMDQIAPYLPDRSVLFDPFQPGKHRYGYAFNRNCSDKSLMFANAPAETVIVFDSTLETRNASDDGASLRINPALDRSQGIRISPAGSNYGFVDGHAKFFIHDVHPSFSLRGGMPSINGNDSSILGAWVNPNEGATKTALIFSPGNIVEKVSPWSGDSRKTVHFYGRYNARPTTLKYIFTRVWVEGKPMYTIAPEKHLVSYALSEDTQTITLKDKHALVYHRSAAYSRHKPKGFLWI